MAAAIAVSFQSLREGSSDFLQTAKRFGAVTLTFSEEELNACGEVPFDCLRRVFDKLVADPSLAARLNACTPAGKESNLKLAPLAEENLKHPGVDRKLPLDMSQERYNAVLSSDPELLEILGTDFATVMSFYDFVEKEVCPAVSEAVSPLVSAAQGSFNYRMLDYFATRDGEASGPRCRAHKDYGTFTVIAADKSGLQCELEGVWTDMHQENSLTILFGWCAYVMSGELIPAVNHRVLDATDGNGDHTWARRLSFSTFVAPPRDYDLKAYIKPDHLAESPYADGPITVQELKDVISYWWKNSDEGGFCHEGEKPLKIERMPEFKSQDEHITHIFGVATVSA